ncbi:flagellar hook-associated protein FlgK [Cellulosimicrobium sp. CUA-896]|uniref:flagellar hook-associated protein FlgK n=1 Tax=Cellulosimicrobium sp. CUA-896 TaxID=1517881 RepID=UPI0021007AC5|nr:flagellar basal body protein [Cellulosimicrobium sp. CUA-896]
MSSFAILNTAFRGLTAAQAGMDVTGQNVSNVNTEGYTRQRVQQSAVAPLGEMGLGRLAQTTRNGQGVSIDGVARLGDLFLEARVRQTASSDGYSGVRADAYTAVEDIHGEPSDAGLSAALQSFWGAWQDVANSPGEDAQAWVVIEEAGAIVDRLVEGRGRVETAWDQARTTAGSLVSEVNTAAGKIAALNVQILTRAGRAARSTSSSTSATSSRPSSRASPARRRAATRTARSTCSSGATSSSTATGSTRSAWPARRRSTAPPATPCGSSGRTGPACPSRSRAASSPATCRPWRPPGTGASTRRPRPATTRSPPSSRPR